MSGTVGRVLGVSGMGVPSGWDGERPGRAPVVWGRGRAVDSVWIACGCGVWTVPASGLHWRWIGCGPGQVAVRREHSSWSIQALVNATRAAMVVTQVGSVVAVAMRR